MITYQLKTIALAEVQEEFWRLMNDGECDVTVEYGTDPCSSGVGSGFPTTRNHFVAIDYSTSPWNLNNFATNELSALRYLPANISAMKVPRYHVGMMFSFSCWQTEDHWSFSITYLHKGEPRTWYGVPETSADAFEAVLCSMAPEPFAHSPDLLHHVTTLYPPDHLLLRGVPVFYLNQLAGEFVVTFPRAYHASFNNGFNFAESVNFCPASWFPSGRDCVDHYALLHRPPVFSHAELLCRLAESSLESGSVPVNLLVIITDQLRGLLAKERSLRRHLARLGVRRTERFVFESRNEETRECQLCKTTLFTSALTCACSKTMLCLEHYQSCSCCVVEDQILLYRYGLDELSQFVERHQSRLREYWKWKTRVEELLSHKTSPHEKTQGESFMTRASTLGDENQDKSKDEQIREEADSICLNQKSTIQELINIWETGRQNRYPEDLVNRLGKMVENAMNCSSVIRSLLSQKSEDHGEAKRVSRISVSSAARKRVASCQPGGKPRKESTELDLPDGPSVTKLTVAEFNQFVEVVNNLPCTIPGLGDLNRFKQRLADWYSSTHELLSLAEKPIVNDQNLEPCLALLCVDRIEQLVEFAEGVDVELRDLRKLKHLMDCLLWLKCVDQKLNQEGSFECRPTLIELLDLETHGQTLVCGVASYYRSPTSSVETKPTTILEFALKRGSDRLCQAISEAQFLECAIKNVIGSPHGSCELSEAEALVAQAADVKAEFGASEELNRLCVKAHSILSDLGSFQRLLKCPPSSSSHDDDDCEGDDGFPDDFVKRLKLNTADSTPHLWLSFYEELCNTSNQLPFVFPDTTKLNTLLTVLDRCYSRIEEVFLRLEDGHTSSSAASALLLEVLLPRPKAALGLLIQRDTGLQTISGSGGKSASSLAGVDARAYSSACGENATKFLEELKGGGDFDHMYDTFYTPMIETELKLLHYLRRSNLHKSKDQNQGSVIYCICRQPGFSGLMLQCELCKDWFHTRCVGFLNKNYDYTRLRYTCPRCERSLRPELSVVIPILEELIPYVTGIAAEQSGSRGAPDPTLATKSSITSGLVAPLVSVPFLLKLPSLAAVQMLCERAFAFVRRVRTVILSTPDLRRALTEYETFSGTQMPWNNFSDDACMSLPPLPRQSPTQTLSSSLYHNQRPRGLPQSHLPPNVARPPGMQPLVLRTTAPRSMADEHHRHQFSSRPLPHLDKISSPYNSQIPVPLSHKERKDPHVDLDDPEEQEGSGRNGNSLEGEVSPLNGRNPKDPYEAEAAVALAIMSSTSDVASVAASKNSPPYFSGTTSRYLHHQQRHRSTSREGHGPPSEVDSREHLEDGGPSSHTYFRCYLPPESRSWLETLITEACALEVSLPQTRWLWQ
uniref:JmjC domain-containing protein n=1 Tax=Mesocestoides corti TaxID=53468 RepID=A0A5K3FRG7_MESCO